jgi:phenylacetate-CoA ligase
MIDIGNILNGYIVKPLWFKFQGNDYRYLLPTVARLSTVPEHEIKRYQVNRIRDICSDAFHSVPYYREKWRGLGLGPDDIHELDDLGKFPILSKAELRADTNAFLSEKSDPSRLIESGTGGTTDSPIVLRYDNKRLLFKTAEMHYFRNWWGWQLGDKIAYLWGAPQDIPNIKSLKYRVMNFFIGRRLYMFASLMDANIMDGIVKRINRFKPNVLQAYSNPVYILSKYITRNNIKIHRPKAVVTTAEPLLQEQRKVIKEAFGCEVFSFYGCREGGYVGVECSEHDGYHINCSSLYVELISGGKKARPGEIGSVVFTDLLNTDMPFIRYQIGDLGVWDDRKCSCGSPLPKMKFFAGRETDVFVTPQGQMIPGVSLCDRVIEDCRGIQQLQFVQNKIEELEVKIVKGNEYSEQDMRKLDEKLTDYFKGNLNIVKHFVEDIPKEKSGKTRFCISNVPKPI